MLSQKPHARFKPAGQPKGSLAEGGDRHVGVAWQTGISQQSAGEFRRVAANATAGMALEAHLHGGDIEADSHRFIRGRGTIFRQTSDAAPRTLPMKP